jgi:hypothetical protein
MVVPYEHSSKSIAKSSQKNQSPSFNILSKTTDRTDKHARKQKVYNFSQSTDTKSLHESDVFYDDLPAKLLASPSKTSLSSTSTITLASSAYNLPPTADLNPTSTNVYSPKQSTKRKQQNWTSSAPIATKSKISMPQTRATRLQNTLTTDQYKSKQLNELNILIPNITDNQKKIRRQSSPIIILNDKLGNLEHQPAPPTYSSSTAYPFTHAMKIKNSNENHSKSGNSISRLLMHDTNNGPMNQLNIFDTQNDQSKTPSPSAFSKYIESVHKALNNDDNFQQATRNRDNQSEYMLFLQLQDQTPKAEHSPKHTAKYQRNAHVFQSTTQRLDQFKPGQHRQHQQKVTRSFSMGSNETLNGETQAMSMGNYDSTQRPATSRHHNPDSPTYVAINFLCNNIIKPTYADECKRIMQRTNMETVAERAALFEDVDLDRYNRLKIKYALLNQGKSINVPTDIQQPISLAHIPRSSIAYRKQAVKQVNNNKTLWNYEPQITNNYPGNFQFLFQVCSKRLHSY